MVGMTVADIVRSHVYNFIFAFVYKPIGAERREQWNAVALGKVKNESQKFVIARDIWDVSTD